MWTIILKKVQFELTKKKFNFFQRPFLVEPCLDRTTSLRRHKIFPFIIFPFTFFPFLAHSNNENVLSTFPFAKCLSTEMIHFLCLFGIHCTHFRNHTFGVGQKISLHTHLSSVNYSDSNYIEYIIHSVMSTFLMNCHPVVVMSFISNIASIDSCEFKILT